MSTPSDATTPDRPRADEVMREARSNWRRSFYSDPGFTDGESLDDAQVSACRAAVGAPDDAPLVILGDGTLGWLDATAWAMDDHNLGPEPHEADEDCIECGCEPLYRLAGPQGGTE